MKRSTFDDLGKLVLRITIAGLMLPHGVAKLRKGVAKIEANLDRHGLPEFIAYGVIVGEVVAPLFMLVGFLTRPAALVFAFNMVVAIWLSHAKDVWAVTGGGGWKIELQMLFLMGAVAIAFLGAGRWAIRRGTGRWD